MSKFRIIKEFHNSYSDDREVRFVIEQKGWFKWKQVYHVEVSRKEINFKTYEDAEQYLLKNYTGHGFCKRSGNVYTYTGYTYYV